MAIPFVILRWLVLFLLSWIGHGAGGWGDTLTFSSLVWFYDWGGKVWSPRWHSVLVTWCQGFHGVDWISGCLSPIT